MLGKIPSELHSPRSNNRNENKADLGYSKSLKPLKQSSKQKLMSQEDISFEKLEIKIVSEDQIGNFNYADGR